MKKKGTIVFVGMSGGVDSSVSAALLLEEGYTVVGVFIRTWQPDFIECTWRDERRDAMRACAHLGIPFLECDAEEAYKKGVADYMIAEYTKGNTPNPDVMCNREVKFGVFWQFAKEHGADFIATGHYTQLESESSNSFRRATGWGVPFGALAENGVKELEEKLFELKQSIDSTKDQTYFLWTLTQHDLAHVLFPVGHLHKSDVRKLALKYKLPQAQKKDSQGVCFLGPLDMKDFLKHYIESKKGDVLDTQGNVIGSHDGAVFFTLGERHGFTLFGRSAYDEPVYVVAKDIEHNTITVASVSVAVDEMRGKNLYQLTSTNWISKLPEQGNKYTAQIRYHGAFYSCRISIDNQKTSIIFDESCMIAQGQSVVVYSGKICMGGGVVV